MSTDADDNGDMVKLNVKVPKRLLEEIDELADELEYTNRSEFVREVLRDTTEPILTPGAQEGVSEGYADVAAGRTMSTDEARERLGIDQDLTDELRAVRVLQFLGQFVDLFEKPLRDLHVQFHHVPVAVVVRARAHTPWYAGGIQRTVAQSFRGSSTSS